MGEIKGNGDIYIANYKKATTLFRKIGLPAENMERNKRCDEVAWMRDSGRLSNKVFFSYFLFDAALRGIF